MRKKHQVVPGITPFVKGIARTVAALMVTGTLWLTSCVRDDPSPRPSVPEAAFVQTVPLYASTAPDALPLIPGTAAYLASQATWLPDLTVYVPAQDSATGAAVIVCPGGGYDHLAVDIEGNEVARYLARQGITAAVLRYRMPNSLLQADPSVAPLLDAQQAMRLMRRNASRWHLRPDRVGMMGFSAGGHVSATAGTRWTSPRPENMGSESIRPDFLALVYPLISMTDSLMHSGSRMCLLGSQPSPALIQRFSADQQVTSASPPAFIVHAEDDVYVPVANSRAFYRACLRNGVPAELRIYAAGNHNFGLHIPGTTTPWPTRFLAWMQSKGLLTR